MKVTARKCRYGWKEVVTRIVHEKNESPGLHVVVEKLWARLNLFGCKVKDQGVGHSMKVHSVVGKRLSQGTCLPNMRALRVWIEKLQPMLKLFGCKIKGQGKDHNVKVHGTVGKKLSRGTCMPIMRALHVIVNKLLNKCKDRRNEGLTDGQTTPKQLSLRLRWRIL